MQRVNYTLHLGYSFELLPWLVVSSLLLPKILVASLTAIIRRSGVVSKHHTGSAPRGVLDVELGSLVVTQVPE